MKKTWNMRNEHKATCIERVAGLFRENKKWMNTDQKKLNFTIAYMCVIHLKCNNLTYISNTYLRFHSGRGLNLVYLFVCFLFKPYHYVRVNSNRPNSTSATATTLSFTL